MNILARLARDSLWLSIARFGTQVCMVVVTYLLARRLSLAEFGEYSFIATAILIGNTLTTFGSDMYLIREIAAKSTFSRLPSAVTLQITLSCLFIIIVFLFVPYLPNQTSESLYALRVYSFALIPLAFFTVFTSALRGVQKMGSYAWLNLAVSTLQMIVVSLFVPRGAGVVRLVSLLLMIQTAAAILAGILCVLYIPHFGLGRQFSLGALSDLFFECLPIAMIAFLGILYQKTSITMLSILGNVFMVSWFSAATRTVEAARIFHFSALTVLYPAMASAYANEDSDKTFRRSWVLLIMIASGIATFLFLLAKPLMDIFFGKEYVQAIPVLKILSLTLIPYTINSFLSLVFLTAKQEKLMVRVLLVSLSILVLSNLWLIPKAGQIGASWTILIAETIQSGLLLFECQAKNLFLQNGVSHELPDLSR